MKIFLDTADVQKIKDWAKTGVIDGVTTNPSHLAKAGGDPTKVVKEICSILKAGEISVEVTKDKPEEVYKQAKAIADLAPNILVKVPCHKKYYSIIKQLVEEKVKLNITLVFTPLQALMMAKLGVEYVSPFVGRWNDIDVDGIAILEEIKHVMEIYGFKTKVLAASIRSVIDFNDAVMIGCDAVTLPINVFEKSLESPLTNQGIEKFNADWKKLGITKFP